MRNLIQLKVALMMVICAAALGSCIVEYDTFHEVEVRESITLQIAVPARTLPKTRSLNDDDESAVTEISVLAFNTADQKLKGQYTGYNIAPTDGSSATLKFEVSLPKGEYDLMIVANANAILAASSSNLVPGTTPQRVVQDSLKITMGTTGWNTTANSTGYKKMPMWGYAKGVDIPGSLSANSLLPGTISLTRMVAKVDVQLRETLPTDSFALEKVIVYNYVEQGRLIPDTIGTKSNYWTTTPSLPTNYTKAYTKDSLEYPVPSPNRSLKNSIYLFEAPEGVAPKTANQDYFENTCLVIRGSYCGGDPSWYRIDFAKRVVDPITSAVTHNYLPILRNNKYIVTITGVSGNGHTTPEDALNSVPANITAEVLDWNQEDIEVLITDGIYMLGVSQGSFELSGHAHTEAVNTDNILTIVTDHPDGWKATIWKDEAGTISLDAESRANWLSLTKENSNNESDYPNGTETKLQLTAKPAEALDPDDDQKVFRRDTAYIHINAGRLNYIVRVIQIPDFPDYGSTYSRETNACVGIFWRANQRGERLVNSGLPINAINSLKKWEIRVLDYGDFKPGDILFSTTPTADRGVTFDVNTENPQDPDTGGYFVDDGKTFLEGNGPPADGALRFRVGLRNTIGPTDHRYARIVIYVRYYEQWLDIKDREEYFVIYLRQGEAPDYLIHPDDNEAKRAHVRKFSPYNLTAPGMNDGVEYLDIPFRGGTFVEYPSQGGARFLHATKQAYPIRAWHPNPVIFSTASYTNMSNTSYTAGQDESCPPGYRRPTTTDTTNPPITSEFGVSLVPPSGSAAEAGKYSVEGWYADGFVDRRAHPQITILGKYTALVNEKRYDVAPMGRLFFNNLPDSKNQYASIFFPYNGRLPWNENNDAFNGYYLSSTNRYAEIPANNITTIYFNYSQSLTSADYNRLMSIRCVEDTPPVLDISGKGNNISQGYSYVGAFWRSNQRGERLIRIPITATSVGEWEVRVLDHGDFKPGEILFSTSPTADRHRVTYNASTETHQDPDVGKYYVDGGKTSVKGVTTAVGDYIKFRVGLKNTISSNQHRYGRIVISYRPNETNDTLHHVIWLRQGDGADYIIHPDDRTDATQRASVRKFSPYNLTARGMSNADYTDIPAANGGAFVMYPSQAGALFQYAGASSFERRAWHPTKTSVLGWSSGSSNWDGSTHETCPSGYRRPITAAMSQTTTSEFGASLFVDPTNQTTSGATTVIGYLADGYFDRKQIVADTAVSSDSYDAAYVGRLIFNNQPGSAKKHASIFFPAAGYRDNNSSTLTDAGVGSYHWSSSDGGTTNGRFMYLNNDGSIDYYGNNARSSGYSVRCVAN